MRTASSAQIVEEKFSGGAHILLVASDIAARLTLAAVLEKSGYRVDSAASAAEAMEKIEHGEYALVLCDLQGESEAASRSVLKFAQTQEYRPATAYLMAFREQNAAQRESGEVLVAPVDIPLLLTQIADLIAGRAADRSRRAVRRRAARLA